MLTASVTDEMRARVRAEREAQGFPATVKDPAALTAVARVVENGGRK